MITALFQPTWDMFQGTRRSFMIGRAENASLRITENRGAETQNLFGTACLRQSHALARPSSAVFISSTECGAKHKTISDVGYSISRLEWR